MRALAAVGCRSSRCRFPAVPHGVGKGWEVLPRRCAMLAGGEGGRCWLVAAGGSFVVALGVPAARRLISVQF